jgi:AAA+ superfamily predicted ATPase
MPRTAGDATYLASQLDRLSRILLARLEGPTDAPRPGPVPVPETGPRPAALALIETLGLTPFEADVLYLAVGAALDGDVRRLLGAAGGSRRIAPTVAGTLSVLIPDPAERLHAREMLGRDKALVRAGLIRHQVVDALDVELIATRRAVAGMLGLHPLDELPPWATRSTLGPLHTWWTDPMPIDAARAMTTRLPPGALCVVRGAAGSGRTTWARTAAHGISPAVLVIDTPHALAGGYDSVDDLLEVLEDAALAGVPVVLDDAGGQVTAGLTASRLAAFLEAAAISLFLVVDDGTTLDARLARRALLRVTVPPPPPEVRRTLWGTVAGADVGLLAEEVTLSPAQIGNARILIERGGVDPVDASIAQVEGGRGLLQPIRNRLRLDGLIVPEEVREELREIILAIRNHGRVQRDWGLAARSSRGQGISALFDGDSGTGKTMACDVIASEVQLPLMRVNVATLVDKYIGETEKNLTRAFAQARALGGILLFDEADALFSSRVDVSRAQDRYANLETNLLLQLMEDHPGLVFLTTNLRRNIDQAFVRRITYNVYFDTPDAVLREQIWRLHLPEGFHEDGLDLKTLATAFELRGGAIKNALIRACYRAAGEGRKIGMTDLVECARLETAAMGKVATW